MKYRPAIQKTLLLFLALSALQLSLRAQEQAVKPKGLYSSEFDIDSITRNITFYIPAAYGKKESYPLVFFLHAEGEAGKTVIKKYGDKIQRLADSSDCIIVYPDAVKGHWNTETGPRAATDTINDAGFINIMIDYFIQQYYCDRDKIFVAGFYAGGDMAWHLGCDASGRIAAIAPFSIIMPVEMQYCSLHTNMAVFNAAKFMTQSPKKLDDNAITAAFNFLLAHGKD